MFCLLITVHCEVEREGTIRIFYLAAVFVHCIYGSSDSIVGGFTLLYLSFHIMFKIWAYQKVVFSPFVCCCFGLGLNHSIDAPNCKGETFIIIIPVGDVRDELLSISVLFEVTFHLTLLKNRFKVF